MATPDRPQPSKKPTPQTKPNGFTPTLIVGIVAGLAVGACTGMFLGGYSEWIPFGLGFGILVAAVLFFFMAPRRAKK